MCREEFSALARATRTHALSNKNNLAENTKFTVRQNGKRFPNQPCIEQGWLVIENPEVLLRMRMRMCLRLRLRSRMRSRMRGV